MLIFGLRCDQIMIPRKYLHRYIQRNRTQYIMEHGGKDTNLETPVLIGKILGGDFSPHMYFVWMKVTQFETPFPPTYQISILICRRLSFLQRLEMMIFQNR